MDVTFLQRSLVITLHFTSRVTHCVVPENICKRFNFVYSMKIFGKCKGLHHTSLAPVVGSGFHPHKCHTTAVKTGKSGVSFI